MVFFNRVFFFICNFISLRPRLKQATPLRHGCSGRSGSSFRQVVEEFQADDFLTPSSSGTRCCVCLSSMEEGRGIETSVLPCLHEFHKVCVDRWFEGRRKTCPICRFPVGGGELHENGAQIFTEEMVIWFSSFHTSGF